jgi:mono/diheme cytochrome c family protein
VNRALAALSLVLLAWLGYPLARSAMLRPETSRPLRGRDLASALGCFACHGAEGRGGVANPGSRRESIPGFTGGTLMMYVHDEDEIRQYILDGRPDRLADDPNYRTELEAHAIRMPSYRGTISPADLDLLVAYVRVVSGMVEPSSEPARRGLEVAERMGCFGCHGALGMGGRDNPRSLKGYIPGFMGEDFRELVGDDAGVREWIREGERSEIGRNPIAGWFFDRQTIEMPSFKRFLSDDDVDALVALLRWIQNGGPEREPLS